MVNYQTLPATLPGPSSAALIGVLDHFKFQSDHQRGWVDLRWFVDREPCDNELINFWHES